MTLESSRNTDVAPSSGEPRHCFTDQIDSTRLARQIESLRRAQRHLARRSLNSILASIEVVVEEWLRDDSPWWREALRSLPPATGFSAEMIHYALPSQIEPLRAPYLRELLERELGASTATSEVSVRAPSLIVHILPGNLAGLAAIPVALSLSLKSAALVKAASGDRVFPQLWAESIRAVDPELGDCIAACYWLGGDRSCEEVAFAGAGLVVASGDDTTLADAQARCAARFIGHGHRISFAVVTREVLADPARLEAAADALALDVAVWDQRGCLSPQVCFVEATFEETQAYAVRLAERFDHWAARLPTRRMSVEEQVAVRRFRDVAEWEHVRGQRREILAPPRSLDWTIIVEERSFFRPTPLCRSLRLVPLPDIGDLSAALRPVGSYLQAAGVAATEPRLAEIRSLLARANVPHVSLLGEMQQPPLSWRQGGRPRIADWVDRS